MKWTFTLWVFLGGSCFRFAHLELLPSHIFFSCLQSSKGNFSQKLWLGVAATSVSIYKQGESEALESFPYGQICSYGVSDSNTFKITAGDRDLIFETSKVKWPPRENNSIHLLHSRDKELYQQAPSSSVGEEAHSPITPTIPPPPHHLFDWLKHSLFQSDQGAHTLQPLSDQSQPPQVKLPGIKCCQAALYCCG